MKYKYLTPEIMQSGQFTAYDGDMYDEADKYNCKMSYGRIKKRHFYELYIGFILVNIIYIFISIFLVAAELKSRFTFSVYIIYNIAYIIAFTFMNVCKRNFNIIFNSISVAGLMFANIGFWFAIAFNAFMTTILKNKYKELAALEGYPIFLRLIIDSKEIKETEGEVQPARQTVLTPKSEAAELEELDLEAELERQKSKSNGTELKYYTAPEAMLEEIDVPVFIDLRKKK